MDLPDDFLNLFITFIVGSGDFSKDSIHRIKTKLARQFHLKSTPRDTEVLVTLKSREAEMEEKLGTKKYSRLVRALVKKPSRTLSGVAPVAIMTSPAPCPHGKCIYCPGGMDTFTPQSYTGFEPAAMRAAQNLYDPFKQVRARLEQYKETGHNTDKVDLIIMGGTFPSRTIGYQSWFVKRALDAMNGFSAPTLAAAKIANETARSRCIGITVETRPDWSMETHINMMLALGTTRVELGVQTVYNDVLEAVERGCTVADIKRSTQLLKDSGLKVVYHMMPNLPGSTPETDRKMLATIFDDSDFRPDMLKIYPTLVLPGTKLYEMWHKGEYRPYPLDDLINVLADMKATLPPYVRIQRIQRDIPSNLISDGVMYSNLRELVHRKLEETGRKCQCIRCREAGRQEAGDDIELREYEYNSSGGKEVFLSYEDELDSLHGYLRLRYPDHTFRPEIGDGDAVVRELKVVGWSLPIGTHDDISPQHSGLGSALLERAEELAKEKGSNNILVTSGIGVREYYRKHGYHLHGVYMVKKL